MKFTQALDALMDGKAGAMWRGDSPIAKIFIDFDWDSGNNAHLVLYRKKDGDAHLYRFTHADIFAKDWHVGSLLDSFEDKVEL